MRYFRYICFTLGIVISPLSAQAGIIKFFGQKVLKNEMQNIAKKVAKKAGVTLSDSQLKEIATYSKTLVTDAESILENPDKIKEIKAFALQLVAKSAEEFRTKPLHVDPFAVLQNFHEVVVTPAESSQRMLSPQPEEKLHSDQDKLLPQERRKPKTAPQKFLPVEY